MMRQALDLASHAILTWMLHGAGQGGCLVPASHAIDRGGWGGGRLPTTPCRTARRVRDGAWVASVTGTSQGDCSSLLRRLLSVFQTCLAVKHGEQRREDC